MFGGSEKNSRKLYNCQWMAKRNSKRFPKKKKETNQWNNTSLLVKLSAKQGAKGEKQCKLISRGTAKLCLHITYCYQVEYLTLFK